MTIQPPPLRLLQQLVIVTAEDDNVGMEVEVEEEMQGGESWILL
jgi:hypothetical protein